ncbi:MAG TPA: transcriptional regulator [Cellvibrio sp.]|nr:transcriptional regulator [Cellvibrio sp.]
MTERWLSVEEISEYLGVSKDTVYTWRNKKGSTMPQSQFGKQLKHFALALQKMWFRNQILRGRNGKY